jgi:hypothetical protein
MFVLTIIVSFLIHYRGATAFECQEWNAKPTDIDIDTKRL